MAKVIAILLVGLLFEAAGVVYLSAGMKQLRRTAAAEPGTWYRPAVLWRLAKAGCSNRNLLLGVAYEAVFFAALCLLLAQRDVSLIWPLSALSFVFTGLAAKVFLQEQISPLRWAGILLIVAGAALITWSEKLKEQAREQPASAARSDRPCGHA